MSDETMMWDEVADIGVLLHELDDEAFDTPSLCDGWAVRDVLGHMGLGHTKTSAGRPGSPESSPRPACAGLWIWSTPRPVRCSTPGGMLPR